MEKNSHLLLMGIVYWNIPTLTVPFTKPKHVLLESYLQRPFRLPVPIHSLCTFFRFTGMVPGEVVNSTSSENSEDFLW